MDCATKSFEISYLKCYDLEDQRHHCYTHLNYYPFICRIRGDIPAAIDLSCDRRMYLLSDCLKHLESVHKFCLTAFDNTTDLCAKHFDLKTVDKVEELIGERLSSKLFAPEGLALMASHSSPDSKNGLGRSDFLQKQVLAFYSAESLTNNSKKRQNSNYFSNKKKKSSENDLKSSSTLMPVLTSGKRLMIASTNSKITL